MKFEKFQVLLRSQQSVDQAGKRTGQHNDLEHILCVYTNFQFDAAKTGVFSTHLNFPQLDILQMVCSGFVLYCTEVLMCLYYYAEQDSNHSSDGKLIFFIL